MKINEFSRKHMPNSLVSTLKEVFHLPSQSYETRTLRSPIFQMQRLSSGQFRLIVRRPGISAQICLRPESKALAVHKIQFILDLSRTELLNKGGPWTDSEGGNSPGKCGVDGDAAQKARSAILSINPHLHGILKDGVKIQVIAKTIFGSQ